MRTEKADFAPRMMMHGIAPLARAKHQHNDPGGLRTYRQPEARVRRVAIAFVPDTLRTRELPYERGGLAIPSCMRPGR